MDIKSNLQLLSEAAAFETKANKAAELKYERVREAYAAIPEVSEPAVTEAADVIVNAIGDDYYVEMVNLAPFMMDSGIKNIGEALDLVASANELPVKSVGLVVESQAYVDSMLKKAYDNAKARGNNKILENALSKLNSNNVVIARLMHEGYKVVKKSPASKVCPKCGKVKCGCTEAAGDVCPKCGKKSCECECGDGSCSTPSNSSSLSENCTYGYCNELGHALEQCTEDNIQPVLEFFKFKGHDFKSTAELRSYIHKVHKEENSSQKLTGLIAALCSIGSIGGAAVGYVTGFSPVGAAISLGSVVLAAVPLIIAGNKKEKFDKKQKHNYERLRRQINNRINAFEDDLEDAKTPEDRKKIKAEIRDLREALGMIDEQLDNIKEKKQDQRAAQIAAAAAAHEDAITFDQLCEQCDIGLLNELKGDFWQYGGVDHLNHGYEIKSAVRKVEKDPRFLDYLGHGLNVYANAQRMSDYNDRAKDSGNAYDTYMSYKAAQQFDQSIQNAPGSKTAKIEAYKNLLHTIDVNIERWRAEAHRNHGQNMRDHANHMVEELKKQRENVHNRLVYLRAEV